MAKNKKIRFFLSYVYNVPGELVGKEFWKGRILCGIKILLVYLRLIINFMGK